MNILVNFLWIFGLFLAIWSGIDLVVNLMRSYQCIDMRYTFWIQCFGLIVGIALMKFFN